jgi:hypothetical protein
MPGGDQSFEGRDSELGRTEEYHSHGRVLNFLVPLARFLQFFNFAPDHVAFERAEVTEEQNTV